MECKFRKAGGTESIYNVLIETLWNVNEYTWDECTIRDCCINRNIVECKLRQNSFTKLSAIVLIETLWNVNERAANAQAWYE